MIGPLDLFLSGLIKKECIECFSSLGYVLFLKLFIINGVLGNSNERTKNGSERGFVEHGLDSV